MTTDEFREKIRRKAIVFDIGGFRPPDDPKASWFGKVNVCQAGESWPMQDGQPMYALAQINLTDLSFRPPRLSDVDLITIFIGPTELPTRTSNGQGWYLKTYRNTDALVALPASALKSPLKALPMRARVTEQDCPCWDDIADECPPEVEENYIDLFENVPGFKLGGWPSLVQSEIFWAPWNKHPASPEYVFQISSTEKGNWMWGDNGVGYFGRGTALGHEDEWSMTWQCF